MNISSDFISIYNYSLSDATELNDQDFNAIQQFVVLLYDRVSLCTEVNKCRRILFTKKQRPVESLPPTENCLRLHVLRAMLQSRYINFKG